MRNSLRLPCFALCYNYIERDAFDALFDNAPEKLNVVKKVLYLILLYAVQSK